MHTPGHTRPYSVAIPNQAEPNARRRRTVMMRMSRRSMLGGTAATVLMGSRARAQSAEFTYKLAHNQPTTHPLHIQAAEAAKRIKADTGGKVDIKSSQVASLAPIRTRSASCAQAQ